MIASMIAKRMVRSTILTMNQDDFDVDALMANWADDAVWDGTSALGVGIGQPTQVVIEPVGADNGGLSAPIDFDDVLDMHIFLKDFSGDFRSLFCERQEGVSPPS